MNNKEENELKAELRADGMHDFEITKLLTDLDKTGIEFGESKLFDLPLDEQKEIIMQEMDACSEDEIATSLKMIDEYHAGKVFTNDGLYLKWAADFITEEIQRYIEGKTNDKDFAMAMKIASKKIELTMNKKLTYAYFKKGVDINQQ